MIEGWKRTLKELKDFNDEILMKGGDIIPKVSLDDVRKGLNYEQVDAIKRAGVVIVRGAVSEDVCLNLAFTAFSLFSLYGSKYFLVESTCVEAVYQRLYQSKRR